MKTNLVTALAFASAFLLSCSSNNDLLNEVTQNDTQIDEIIDNDDNIIQEARLLAQPNISPAKWMNYIESNTMISAITIPGTHETGAIYGGAVGYAKCQEKSIDEQLQLGVRFLDIRVRYHDGDFTVHHGAYYQHLNFTDVLKSCERFLHENPSEIIIMSLKEEYSDRNPALFTSKFMEYINKRKDKYGGPLFNLTKKSEPLKNLRGKVMLFRRFSTDNDEKKDIKATLGINVKGKFWEDDATFNVDNYDRVKLRIQDVYDVRILSNKYSRFNALINDAESDNIEGAERKKFYVNFASGVSVLYSPKNVADYMNPQITSLLKNKYSSNLGIIMTDYVTSDLSRTIYMTNFPK